MAKPRLTAATVAVIAAAAAGLLAATGYRSGRHTDAAVSPGRAAARQISASLAGGTSMAAPASRVIRSASARPPRVPVRAVWSVPAITTPSIPDRAAANGNAVEVARAWAIAANSSSYVDPHAGSWTARAAALVTGAEAAAERQQRSGGGGIMWAQIQAGRCVTGPRELAAGVPSDGPTGRDRRIVEVTAITTMTCAAGQVQLSRFAAQLTVIRVQGRWLVADVRH